jgi:molybdate transport system substrate-binding protein
MEAPTWGRVAAGALLAVLLLAAGCGGAADPPGAAGAAAASAPAPSPTGDLLVFAAASLGDAFAEVAAELEGSHPGVEVRLNLAGSQRLAAQILEGAPADVFASANAEQMDTVADGAGLEGQATTFASNRLAIAVEPGNPLGVRGLRDLARPGLTLVMAAEDVPAGRYARQALKAAGVTASPASLEQDVRAVLSRVALGEADAGIVYRSDIAAAAGDVEEVEIQRNVAVAYPIAVLGGAPNPEAARAFVDLVTSPRGQAILTEHGFSPP